MQYAAIILARLDWNTALENTFNETVLNGRPIILPHLAMRATVQRESRKIREKHPDNTVVFIAAIVAADVDALCATRKIVLKIVRQKISKHNKSGIIVRVFALYTVDS